MTAIIQKFLKYVLLTAFLIISPGSITAVDGNSDIHEYSFPAPILQNEWFYEESIPLFRVLPAGDETRIVSFFGDEEVAYGGEFLYSLESVFPQLRLIDIYNGLLGFGRMNGLTYFSTRDNAEKILIEASYRIASPHAVDALPDILLDEPIPKLEIYIYQKMRDFGPVIWHVYYTIENNKIFVELRNEKAIYLGPLRIINKGDFKAIIAAVPKGNDLILYQASTVVSDSLDILKFFGFGNHLRESFYQRMKALAAVYSGGR